VGAQRPRGFATKLRFVALASFAHGVNLDQSIAIRIGQIVGDSSLTEMAYNKYPVYLVGPWNLGQRFLMHGFFTEYLHARLEEIRTVKSVS